MLLVGQGIGTPHIVERRSTIDIDAACPSTYHEFEGPEAIPYDTEGKPITFYSAW